MSPTLEGRGERLLSVHPGGGEGSSSPRSPGRPLGPGQDLASCCGSVGNEAFGTERAPLSLCGCELGAVICVFFFIPLRPHGVWRGVAPPAPSLTRGVHGQPWNSRRGTALVLLPSPFPSPRHTQRLDLVFISSTDQEGYEQSLHNRNFFYPQFLSVSL